MSTINRAAVAAPHVENLRSLGRWLWKEREEELAEEADSLADRLEVVVAEDPGAISCVNPDGVTLTPPRLARLLVLAMTSEVAHGNKRAAQHFHGLLCDEIKAAGFDLQHVEQLMEAEFLKLASQPSEETRTA